MAGGNKADYLSYIRRRLDDAQRDMNISFIELIEYSTNGKSAMLDLELLLQMFRDGVQSHYVKDMGNVNVTGIISSIAPAAAINALVEKLRAKEMELSNLRHNRDDTPVSTELWNILCEIRERNVANYEVATATYEVTTDIDAKTTALLANTINIIKKIENFTDEQRFSMQVIFDELKQHKVSIADPELMSMIEAVLSEVEKGNSKTLGEKLIKFIGVAGSCASIYPSILKLIELLT